MQRIMLWSSLGGAALSLVSIVLNIMLDRPALAWGSVVLALVFSVMAYAWWDADK